jgi:hypothetical protein
MTPVDPEQTGALVAIAVPRVEPTNSFPTDPRVASGQTFGGQEANSQDTVGSGTKYESVRSATSFLPVKVDMGIPAFGPSPGLVQDWGVPSHVVRVEP